MGISEDVQDRALLALEILRPLIAAFDALRTDDSLCLDTALVQIRAAQPANEYALAVAHGLTALVNEYTINGPNYGLVRTNQRAEAEHYLTQIIFALEGVC